MQIAVWCLLILCMTLVGRLLVMQAMLSIALTVLERAGRLGGVDIRKLIEIDKIKYDKHSHHDNLLRSLSVVPTAPNAKSSIREVR